MGTDLKSKRDTLRRWHRCDGKYPTGQWRDNIDLARLNNIIEINLVDMTVTVESGVILEDLEVRLKELGMMHGHDPYSVPIATVGGTISTNGVGYRAGAYGPMGDQVV